VEVPFPPHHANLLTHNNVTLQPGGYSTLQYLSLNIAQRIIAVGNWNQLKPKYTKISHLRLEFTC